jgi:DNA modification methylase
MSWDIKTGHVLDVLAELEPETVQTCVTSPPYWGLRDYGDGGQEWPAVTYAPMPGLPPLDIPSQTVPLGLEPDPWAYVGHLVEVFRGVRRVLRDDGTLWLNLGDTYAAGCMTGRQGSNSTTGTNRGQAEGTALPPRKPPPGLKPKDLCGIPWRVAYALQADGWYLRSDIIWHKPNPMPESITDRPTKAHEYLFLLTKDRRYFYDADAIRQPAVTFGDSIDRPDTTGAAQRADLGQMARTTPVGRRCGVHASGGRNARSVWTITTRPYSAAHFATFPPDLPERCIKAGSRPGDLVLDPFSGAGTTGMVARRLQRSYIGAEQSEEYAEMSRRRIEGDAPLFNRGSA